MRYLIFNSIVWLSLQSIITGQNSKCAAIPSFTNKFGFDTKFTALSTDETSVRGLCLIDVRQKYSRSNPPFQHESWDDYGNLSTILRDPNGNCYVFGAPSVNVLYNDPLKQNTLLRVDKDSGIMAPWMEFNAGPKNTSLNPFGLLGIAYDCKTFTMYASSVYHSDRKNEKGIIYHFNPESKKILGQLADIDAIGLQVFEIGTERILLIGKARTSDVYSIKLAPDGGFVGKPKLAFTIEGLGPRGDDKVRKFHIDAKTGDLLVFGTEFYFNLIAPSQDQASTYRFRYDNAKKKWAFIKIE